MKHASIFFCLLMLLELPLSVGMAVILQMLPADYHVLVSVLVTQGYFLVLAGIYMLIKRMNVKKELGFHGYKVSSFFLSLLVLLCATPMATWLNLFSQLFSKNEVSNSIYELTQVLPVGLAVLVIGCLPGFVEEFLYRGIIYRAFRTRSVLTGVIVSALTFGLMHMNFNQILYAVYLGILFAFVVEATGSLYSSMILHMLFNACNTAYLYILPKMYDFLAMYDSQYANIDLQEMMNQTPAKKEIFSGLLFYTPLALGGVFLSVLLIRQIAKLNGRELTLRYICGDKDEVRMTSPLNVPLVLGCLFCIVIAVASL